MQTIKNYTFWTSQEENKLKELAGKMSFKQMTSYFNNKTATSLQKKALKLGLLSQFKPKKYSHDENFWEIPNEINCYWAGFFAADGCLLHDRIRDRKSFVVSLSSKDLNHLEKLKETLKFTGPIKSYSRKNYKKETYKNVSTLAIHSIKKWEKDLENNFNIIPNKTLRLAPPNLNDDYLKFCYLIGYLDGDGWITIKKDGRITIGFVSSSSNILIWIYNLISSKFPQVSKISTIDNRYHYFTFSNNSTIKIINYLRPFLVPKLDRKWNNPKLLEILNSPEKV